MNSRYIYETEISRNVALERELQIERDIDRRRAFHDSEFRRFRDLQKIRAENQYIKYKEEREAQKRAQQQEFLKSRILRQQINREHEAALQAERIAAEKRQQQMILQQRVFEEERAKQANVDAEMRRLEVENRTRNKEEANVSNLRVLEEQAEQERLERELRDIDIAIGTIYDEREGRKKLELRELEDLDNQSIDLKQQMRASKVKQKALEDSLADLSKIMT